MLTDGQVAALTAAKNMLGNYNPALPVNADYMDGWRGGCATTAASDAFTALGDVLRYEARCRSELHRYSAEGSTE